jgi:hypothetical protein
MGEFHDNSWLEPWSNGLAEFARTKYPKSGSPDTITIVRDILSDGKPTGLAAFNIKLDAFASLVDQSFNMYPENVCIMSSKGDIFYATDHNLLNSQAKSHSSIGASYPATLKSDGKVFFDGGKVSPPCFPRTTNMWLSVP